LRDIAAPVPGRGEVLVRVRAAGADPGVWHAMTGVPYLMRVLGFGFRRPRVPVLQRALAARGTLVLVGGERYDRPALTGLARQASVPLRSLFTRQRLRSFIARQKTADLRTLTQLAQSGALTPVIGRTYPLSAAADAIRDIAAGHATGKGVITV